MKQKKTETIKTKTNKQIQVSSLLPLANQGKGYKIFLKDYNYKVEALKEQIKCIPNRSANLKWVKNQKFQSATYKKKFNVDKLTWFPHCPTEKKTESNKNLNTQLKKF